MKDKAEFEKGIKEERKSISNSAKILYGLFFFINIIGVLVLQGSPHYSSDSSFDFASWFVTVGALNSLLMLLLVTNCEMVNKFRPIRSFFRFLVAFNLMFLPIFTFGIANAIPISTIFSCFYKLNILMFPMLYIAGYFKKLEYKTETIADENNKEELPYEYEKQENSSSLTLIKEKETGNVDESEDSLDMDDNKGVYIESSSVKSSILDQTNKKSGIGYDDQLKINEKIETNSDIKYDKQPELDEKSKESDFKQIVYNQGNTVKVDKKDVYEKRNSR